MPKLFANLSLLVQSSDKELESLLKRADFGNFVVSRDLPPLRARLLRLERERGITALHRRVSRKILGAGARLVETPRYTGIQRASALSPCGSYLAIVSGLVDTSGSTVDVYTSGDLRIWELATGLVVDVIGFKQLGGVGGRNEPSSLQWSPSGEWLGVVFNYADVGVLRPFAGSTRPSFTVDVTRRWGSPPPQFYKRPESVENMGHPPAWCWSPDERDLFVSTPGPEQALGCIVPFRDGAAFTADSAEVRWCPARLRAKPSESSPHTWVRWSPDGSRVYGYCVNEYDGDGASYSSASAIDVRSGNLQFRFDGAEVPMAFSPDGALLAYGEKHLTLADGHTGRTIASLSKQIQASYHWVSELVWSRDGRRLAVVINDYERPAVCVFEAGKLLCQLKMESVATSRWHGDRRRWAWSPDGTAGACLLGQSGVELWEVGRQPRLLRRLEGVGGIQGLEWGADNTLVGVGASAIAFWDMTSGHLRSHFEFDMEPGHMPPLDSWNPWPDASSQFIPTEHGWAFTRVDPDGTVVGPPGAQDRLAPRLMFSVEGRHAWPWRWAIGTRHTRLEEQAPVAKARRRKAPFAEHRIPVPKRETAQARAARHAERGPLERYQVPTFPISHYRADPVFQSGPAICRENLAPYVGQVVILYFNENAGWYDIASLLEVTDEGILLDSRLHLSPARRIISFSMINWIGPAVPLR
ncbi:WD40 repeat domain-containing protein [Hyalangium versicolor]|uniref:WD40 repeat domain-containing protein n=1 Tax=Hyalangium versicolor TaxID=2861190 RepID=UPI001CC9A92E|nr:hypothetical protein [Hyalangium versicolor]